MIYKSLLPLFVSDIFLAPDAFLENQRSVWKTKGGIGDEEILVLGIFAI
jgi:hypothetical protein